MIDTTKNFTRTTGSLEKALGLIRTLVVAPDRLASWTTSRYTKTRRIDYASGDQATFKWFYDGDSKRLTVTYTDGREQAIEKDKPTYYVVWIEGIEPISGEKIKTLTETEHDYTTNMTEALRVRSEHLDLVKRILRNSGVAEWALNNCFHKVHYAPKGTLYNPDKSLEIRN